MGMFLCLKYLNAASFVPYLSIVCILGYIVGFAVGPGPVPWIWNSEYFPQRARGPAGSVSCALNWTAAFLVGKFFPIGTVLYNKYRFYNKMNQNRTELSSKRNWRVGFYLFLRRLCVFSCVPVEICT